MANLTDFRTRFPEFDDPVATDERVELFLGDSELIVPKSWGNVRDIGIYYLTAHNLAVSIKTSSGNVGGISQVASRAVEGVSISYNNKTADNNSEDYYSSTSYGKRYLDLERRKNVGMARLV